MAHPPEIRQKLRTAYIGGLSLEIASVQAGVPYATARRWFTDAKAAGDDWDKMHTVQTVEDMAKADPDHDWRIYFEAPLYSAEYQRQGEGVWVLIRKGEGFA